MMRRKRLLLVLFTILFCFVSDQATKSIAKIYLKTHRTLHFAGDTLRLDYVENKGAVLTFEPYLPKEWRGRYFSILVSALLGFLILLLLLYPSLRSMAAFGLTLICGGMLSNLLDRLVLGGYVVDFLNLGWGGMRTGIFNVADIFISFGLVLFVLSLLGYLLLPRSRNRNSPSA